MPLRRRPAVICSVIDRKEPDAAEGIESALTSKKCLPNAHWLFRATPGTTATESSGPDGLAAVLLRI